MTQRLRRLCRRLSLLTLSSLAALGSLFVVVTVTPLVSWWAGALAGPWEDPRGDVLIVLGGSILEGGILGESSYWRSVYAVLVWREGGFRQVILSGGGPEGHAIVAPMRDFLLCQGVPHGALRLETYSTSTRGNALYTRELLAGESGRKVLLTSDFHMFRAYRAFQKVGLDVVPRPYPDVRKRAARWMSRWPAFLDLAGETVKIGYYYARGWI
jgi:uncharacterized SAM-binding protein YcdF (DUF218 family)